MDWDYIRYLLYVKALETSLAMGEEFRNLSCFYSNWRI